MSGLDLPQSVEREMLSGSINRLLADTPRPGWRDLVEAIGLAGLTVPEAAGGFGGGVIEIAVAMVELGPALAGADWLSHAAAAMLIARVAPDHAALPDLATGALRAAIVCPASCAAMPGIEAGGVHGTARLVAGAAEADMFLIVDAGGILLVPADHGKIEQRHRIMYDGCVTADLGLALGVADSEWLAEGAQAPALAEWITDLMLAARCAEAVGLMQRMVSDSADYMGQRRQFGAPIGSFQALRHRAADMQLALMKAAALTEIAVLAADRDGADRARSVSAACVEVTDAVRIVGEGAVQIHGAMGLTEELNLGACFKRALSIAAAFGSRADHLARYAEAAV